MPKGDHPFDCKGVWTPGRRHDVIDHDRQRQAERDTGENGPLHHFADPVYNLRRRPDADPLIRKIWDTGEEREFFWYTVWYIRSTPIGEGPKWIKDAIKAALHSSDSFAGMVGEWTRLDGEGPHDATCVVDIVEDGGAYVQRGNPCRMQLPMYAFREARQGGNFPSTIRHERMHEGDAAHDMDKYDAPGDDSSGYAGLADYGADRTDHVTESDARKIIRWREGLTRPALIHD